MRPGLPRLMRPLACLGLLLASLPATSGATGDRPTVRDAGGRPVPLDAPRGGALAIVFLSAECPIANAESPTLEAIAHAFPAGRFRLVGVFVDPDLTRAGLAAHAAEYHLTFPVARDPGLALARHYQATVTPEAFVLDDAGRVRYRGRIDDAFVARTRRNAAPRTRDLRDAVAAVLDGRPVDRPEVKAVGCPMPEPPAAASASATFHRDVEPILRAHCQDCHRPGQVAPFSLLTFDQARKRAHDLAALAADRRMPPWPASPDEGGPFRDARLLSPREIATLEAWADAGAPEGDPGDAPPPPTFPGEWPLGPPDLVLTVPEPYALGAEGPDEFRVFVLPTGLAEGKWVQAVDFRPGNRKVVHHILAAIDTHGVGRRLDERDPAPGYPTFSGFGFLPAAEMDGWAPGKAAHRLDDGVARYVPAGSDFLLQVHYHRTGRPESDRSSVGLYFARKPVDKQLYAVGVFPPIKKGTFLTPDLTIPPGAADHEVRGSLTLRNDIQVRAVIPHMHWLGKDFLLTARPPDGPPRTLIKVNRWGFNWQGTYDLAAPLALPKGTRIEMLAHFDNTETNPANPSRPPRAVSWGEQTTDEMCIGFLHYTIDAEHLDGHPPTRSRWARP